MKSEKVTARQVGEREPAPFTPLLYDPHNSYQE